MDNTYLPLAVHVEYAKRMDDEHVRQNKRISDLEKKVEDIGSLTASVESLAKSIEQMAKAQKEQGKRLEALEQKPAKKLEAFAEKVVWAVASALIAFLLAKFGIV